MKKTDLAQIKNMDIKEIFAKVKALKVEISDLTLDKNTKKLKDLKSISKRRKDLAQVLTIAKQKQIIADLEKIVTETKKEEVK